VAAARHASAIYLPAITRGSVCSDPLQKALHHFIAVGESVTPSPIASLSILHYNSTCGLQGAASATGYRLNWTVHSLLYSSGSVMASCMEGAKVECNIGS
jgi:hypothetical protein